MRGYPEIERKLRVLSIRRLFHEEVCSYAYAVHALFNEELLSEADDQAVHNPTHDPRSSLCLPPWLPLTMMKPRMCTK